LRYRVGKFGLVPPGTTKEDEICRLVEVYPPFVLRRGQKTGAHGERYELVGSCYVRGLMREGRHADSWESYYIE